MKSDSADLPGAAMAEDAVMPARQRAEGLRASRRRLASVRSLPGFVRRRWQRHAPLGPDGAGIIDGDRQPGRQEQASSPSGGDFAGLEGLARHRRRIGAVMTLGLAVAMMAVFVTVQPLVLRLFPRARWWLPPFWYRSICWLTGTRLAFVGTPVSGPALFVANHVSWLDILVLGSALPRAAFISKREVREWGIFGRCAELAHSVFIDRTRRGESARQRDMLLARLAQGDRLILFPEGTSTDGTGILPFKSALFAVAEIKDDLPVQPVSLCYTHVNGVPVARADRPKIGWFGDMELIDHVISLMGLGRIRAEVRFHPPITLREAGSRKALAQYCERMVRAGLDDSRKARPGRQMERHRA
ncbi:MAG: 1-acyl-sn-glycerol-3-phosphate acyltransferase [Alphaproteobacteria bacterium]|nr:MAG: 1-acyl-sn-glycerol-3-phosphate acyltransferase [Alphaproteobacteria bacterium]